VGFKETFLQHKLKGQSSVYIERLETKGSPSFLSTRGN